MNLQKLFKMQRQLDEYIEQEHPRQEGEDRLAKKILALMVELGELANELPEVFKFWSNKKNNREKALKEYVDCLHFLLSIGLSENIGTIEWEQIEPYKSKSTVQQFIVLFEYASLLLEDITVYVDIWSSFIGLGEMLGFTWEQVEEAYMQKHAENIARQERGY
ncbi:dUTP diphosphatase [Geobacillus sp. FJAT-46040]|uniref:dUTP diphosphatase n=1 Tax=Geobacillus sp. FJAT-46040 TaxID=2011017 RepID=UPI000BB889E1|nr:dUTP diphosphatase [Geobacillus sp. FJAT-46040]